MDTIVVSAINLRSGGTLSVLDDCLSYLDQNLSTTYKIVALVHNKSLLAKTKNIIFIEYPKSTDSYFLRLFYEYFYFKRLALKLKPILWLSLHDISPNVSAKIQAVYCHNPSPFYKLTTKDIFLDPKFVLFCWFYRYLYAINIKKNNYVIVQQDWLRKKFIEMYNVKNVIVSYPNVEIECHGRQQEILKKQKIMFFYPSFPRVFKNFEIICEAVGLVDKKYKGQFEVVLTINGKENRYSKFVFDKYKGFDQLRFIGLIRREEVFEYYEQADCLLFPSKLETWGMPISEFKEFGKPVFVADLEYARETVGEYEKVKFFDPNDAEQLAELMMSMIDKSVVFEPSVFIKPSMPFSNSWAGLFQLLLK